MTNFVWLHSVWVSARNIFHTLDYVSYKRGQNNDKYLNLLTFISSHDVLLKKIYQHQSRFTPTDR